ncbi:MAG: hypothetical protein OHK0046_28620 [Anaerolineae bacterium]
MILVDWGNAEETLLVWKFEGHWTPEEVFAAVDQVLLFASGYPHMIDIIVDTRRAHLPAHPMNFNHREFRHKPGNLGQIVVIYEAVLWSMLYDMLTHLSGIDYGVAFVQSVDDAYKLVERAETNRLRAHA